MTGGSTGLRLEPCSIFEVATAGTSTAFLGTTRALAVEGPWFPVLSNARKSRSLATITPARWGGSGGHGGAATFHFQKPGVAGLEGAATVALDGSGDVLDVWAGMRRLDVAAGADGFSGYDGMLGFGWVAAAAAFLVLFPPVFWRLAGTFSTTTLVSAVGPAGGSSSALRLRFGARFGAGAGAGATMASGAGAAMVADAGVTIVAGATS